MSTRSNPAKKIWQLISSPNYTKNVIIFKDYIINNLISKKSWVYYCIHCFSLRNMNNSVLDIIDHKSDEQ